MGNTNSFNTALCKNLIRVSVPTIQATLAPIPRIARVLPGSKTAPATQGEIPNVTSASTTLRNPTNWENGNCVLGALAYTPVELSQPFHLKSAELQGGVLLDQLTVTNARAFAKAVFDEVLGVFTEENFGTFATTNPAVFGQAEVNAAMEAVKSPARNLLLSTEAYAAISPALRWNGSEWSLPGFQGVFEVSDWGTAGPGICGAVADSDALAIVHSLPVVDFRPQPTSETFTLPQVELSALACAWCQPGSRTAWASFDAVIAVAVAKAASCKLLKAAS